MRRSGPPERRTPLARTGRLRPRSKNPAKQAKARARAAFVAEVLEARPWCEAGPAYRRHIADLELLDLAPPACLGRAVDVHERQFRGRGGDTLDPDNVAAICRACHDFTHGHPHAAGLADLARPSTH